MTQHRIEPGAHHAASTRRPSGPFSRFVDAALKYSSIAALVGFGGYLVAQQVVSPNRRTVKMTVLLALLALMLRFDMVWSLFVFVLLFPFPSGVSIGSTNNVLMTLIPLVWLVRATSQKVPLLNRTPADIPILAFMVVYLLSFVNVEPGAPMTVSIKMLWTQITAITFYYLIVKFVDDEKKLERFAVVVAVACSLVMFTAVVELLFPGTTIIPGWIETSKQLGVGKLKYRMEGIRVGGAFQSHGMLSDFGTQIIMFMVYFFVRSRNPLPKVIWASLTLMTLVAILATANRGAGSGLLVGSILMLVFFSRRIPFHARVLVVLGSVSIFVAAQLLLDKYTVATSLIDRFLSTEIEGVVPENRVDTWVPAIKRSMEHPLIGHGPFYDTTRGLDQALWPHNGYIFTMHQVGIIGLGAFLWLLQRIASCGMAWRHAAVRNTHLGALAALGHIWFFVLLVEQLRTDFQRDDIYPYIVWMCFGFLMASWRIIENRIKADVGE